ncbi:uncharacterized protein LOC120413911 [Culex pipiens pallens]|uniref:uncharacterized protein LOC120413911 n=1 Tax=Culex pipiens pallens TaxID=42434 RepID=UPI001953088D|nr:uncharacterized protein LOC120413911 [Culex pipiens pallens]
MLRTPKGGKKKTPKKKTPANSAKKSDAQKSETKDAKEEKVVPVTPISEQLQEQRRKEEARKMEEQLKVLMRQRDAVAEKLERVKAAIRTTPEQPNQHLKNLHFLKLQLKTVEACYGEYNAFQNQVYGLVLTPEQEKQHRACYLKFEALHNNLTIQLNELIERLSKPSVALVPAGPATAVAPQYLPPLSVPLPKFDGTYENWFSFKCMFKSVMDRYQGEAPSMKLYHLRNSLVGKAEGVIDQDIINNNDYDAAWALLVETYEDKRVIINKHIDALFSLPKVTRDNFLEFRKLIEICAKNTEALKNLQLPVSGLGEQMLLNLIAARMDKDTRKSWESLRRAGELPSYAATMAFLKEKCRVLELVEQCSEPVEKVKPQRSVKQTKTLVIASDEKCTMCDQQHDLQKCEQFKAKSVNEKYNHLRKCGSCFNCLKKGHRTAACTSTRTCQQCSKRHHTMLHTDKKPEVAPNTAAADAPKANADSRPQVVPPVVAGTSQTQSLTLCATTEAPTKQTLLSTAVVLVYGGNSVPYLCRALIDSCSQNHFITERCANLLAIKKERTDYQVSGLNGGTTRINHMVRTTMKSRVGNFTAELELLVAPKITGDVPTKTIDVAGWDLPRDVELADPSFNKRGRVDLLLGAGVFWDLMKSGRVKLAANLPSLSETELGWVVGGVMSECTPVIARTFCTVNEDEELNKLLNRFWEIEGVEDLRRPVTSTADECLEQFRSTYNRKPDGRIVVRLPFNERKSDLGDSRDMAIRRFLSLERRLDQQPDLKGEYAKFIHE